MPRVLTRLSWIPNASFCSSSFRSLRCSCGRPGRRRRDRRRRAVAAPQANPAAAATDVPKAVPAAPPAAAAPVVPGQVPPAAVNGAAAGRTITITTDLFRAEVDTTGGVITQVALLKHRDPGDAGQALPGAPEDAGTHLRRPIGVARRGNAEPSDRLRGAARPAGTRGRNQPHRAPAPGDRAERRQDPAGTHLRSRQLCHQRRLRHHERRHRAGRPVRLFPVDARHQDAGDAELDGSGLLCGARHLQRDRQVQEGRVRRARQACRRSDAQAAVYEECGQRLGGDGRALFRRRVASGRREEDRA